MKKRGGGLFQSTLVVGALTLLSRVLGFVRDVVFARLFGAGPAMDAFLVAFKIPNFLRRLFAEGAFAQAFVPVFSEYRTRRTRAELQELTDRVCGTLAVVLFVVTAVGVVAAPVLISMFAPGFVGREDQHALATDLLRLTFPYLFFISLTAFAGGILNSYGRFSVPAVTPVLLNLALIVAALWGAPHFTEPVTALAWGVFAAGVLQLLFQLPFLWRLKLLPRPRWGWRFEGVRRILRLMLPTLFGSSVAQINLLLDTVIASFLAVGSVSWLYYSDRLMEFPLGIFGIAMGTVILPALSRRHAEHNPRQFSRTLDWALRLSVLFGLPAAAGLMVLASPVLTTLFLSEVFTAHDVNMASLSLMAYAVGLPGFILVKVLVPAFFARQDTVTPVKIGVAAMFTNMALNIAIVVPLVMAGFNAPHAGLALATSAAAWLNAGLLYLTLRRRDIYTPEAGWGAVWLRTVVALGVMAGLLVWGALAEPWVQWSVFERVTGLLGWVLAGASVYLAVLWASGLRPRHLRGPADANTGAADEDRDA